MTTVEGKTQALEAEVVELRNELAELRQKFRFYFQHLGFCCRGLPSAGRPCNCGAFELLGPISEEQLERRREHAHLGPFPNLKMIAEHFEVPRGVSMTTGKIVCSPGKHLVPVELAVVTRCRLGCTFRAVACLEHGGLGANERALSDHMVAVIEHGGDKILEQCVDALEKAHRGIAELIVCGCTSDADMEVEMTAIHEALKAAGKAR